MRNFVRWLREIYRWVWRAPITRHYCWVIAVVAACVVVVGAYRWTEQAFRLAGMFLQLGGVLTVVWGILTTRAEFGQPTIRSQFRMWSKTFPPLQLPTVTMTGGGKITGLSCKGYGYSTQGPAADQTIEGRLGHLESIIKIEQYKTHVAAIQAKEKADRALEAQARLLSGKIDTVAKRIEATATGGVHVSAVGVVLLFVGTIFGGAAFELHQLLIP